MVPFSLRLLSAVVSLSVLADAANDWSKPCFQGQCEYDLPLTGPSSGTLKITGSSITDITPAAGWEILDCSPDALSQNIRLVCATSRVSDCEHLEQNTGAAGKIVRLPENCGQTAFAHISKAWIPADQSIPSDVRPRIWRRNDQTPQVKALHIDTDFGSVEGASTVNFTLYGANVPGIDLSDIDADRRRRFGDILDGLRLRFNKKKGFDAKKDIELPPITFNKMINVFNQSVDCSPVKAGVSVDINTEASVLFKVGIAASGSMVPPRLDSFAALFGVSADLSGGLNLSAELSGVLVSEKIKTPGIPIPAFGFPGLITVGPSFQVDVQAIAKLDVVADLFVGFNYQIKGAQFEFPPNPNSPKGNFLLPQDTPLKLSASPSAKATGSIEGHIIPSLNLGLDAFAGTVGANIFLELDTSAKMKLEVHAAAEVATAIAAAPTSSGSLEQRKIVRRVDAALPPEPTESSATVISPIKTSSTSAFDFSSSLSPASEFSSSSPSSSSPPSSSASIFSTTDVGITSMPTASLQLPSATAVLTSGASASVSGCFDISAGFDINAGADGSFFNLFDANSKINLFSRQFDLFKKCFGDQANTRRGLRTKARFLGRRAGLVCPLPNTQPQSLVDEVIDADGIKAI